MRKAKLEGIPIEGARFAQMYQLHVWLATASAMAAEPFDGSWLVSVMTREGSCGTYSSELLISQGRIGTPPGVLVSGSGKVIWVGVAVDFVSASSAIRASGRAKKSAAQGHWRAPTLSCSGTWQALRR